MCLCANLFHVAKAKPGWYPNPSNDPQVLAKGKLRYWDGTRWMPRYADAVPKSKLPGEPPAEERQTWADRGRYVWQWVVGAGILLSIFLVAAFCSVIDPNYSQRP
jgi:hypothetical protein